MFLRLFSEAFFDSISGQGTKNLGQHHLRISKTPSKYAGKRA